jgi:aerobic carbon-monoxide dehydrogenase large subunit
VIAQIGAETLGIDYAGITVTHGQTDRIARGQGARASRVTVMTGNATLKAARGVRAILLDTAAGLLQTPADSLTIADGVICHMADAGEGPSLTIAEAASATLLERGGDRIAVEETHEIDRATYSFGVHFAQVAVDRATAGVTIERFAIAYDIGRAVNPMLVEGQLVGGAVQGIGGALFEEFVYDKSGQPLSVTFADYLMPTAAEVPDIDCLVCEDAPSTTNELGLKSGGDAGITGAGAAIAAAIGQAIGRPGAVTRLPVTPSRLHAILHDKDV